MEIDTEYFDLEFGGEIGLFEAYLNDMESFLASEITRLKAEIKDAVILDEKLVNMELDVVGVYFANIMRKSFLISLYSFLEYLLMQKCRSQKGDILDPSALGIRGKNDVDRARIYLTKVLHVSFPSNSQEWKEIQNIRMLRNCIAHNNGRCDKDKYKKLRDYVAQNSDILSLSSSEIVISGEYCNRALRTVGKFIEQLLPH